MEFIRFCIVGVINTGVDFAVYLGLTRPMPFWSRHYVLASACSFTIAVLSSFLLNTFWTFRHSRLEWRRSLKFFAVAVGGLALNAATLYALTHLGVFDLFAKAAATAVVLAWNFTLQKKWTFREVRERGSGEAGE